MSGRFPEPIEFIRHFDPVRRARGGHVRRVIVRLSNGRASSFYEASIRGSVTTCEDRGTAFDVLRHSSNA
jgi:hypothetical protein